LGYRGVRVEGGQALFFAKGIGDILEQITLYLGCVVERDVNRENGVSP
jgi:hypothetical protein